MRKEDVQRNWILIDAAGKPVGRVSTQIATLLRGKHKPSYTPHVDGGDYVVVINAEQAVFTGQKEQQKVYLRYTGYPGGQRATTAQEMRAKHPERIIEKAVKGMLPKNRLGRAMYRKLFVYSGDAHPHAAQKPQPLND